MNGLWPDEGITRNERRVLCLLAGDRDEALAPELIGRHGFAVTVCHDVEALGAALSEGAGVVLAAEEALLGSDPAPLRKVLEGQPSWSDVPLLIVTRPGRQSLASLALEQLGNVTFLERPLRLPSLSSTLRSALTARRRQYETRDAIRNRDNFLAMLGHELRNPLAAIDLALQVQRAEGSRPMEIIERQTRNLRRIVDDLLEIGRITRGDISVRRTAIDVTAALRASAQAARAAAEQAGLRFVVEIGDEPLGIRGDAVRLEQVFANLISNAIKFTPSGGVVTVSARREGDEAVVRVRDTGTGIPPHLIESVFGLFSQGYAGVSRRKGGLGMGLYLVRTLIEMHGGTVTASSEGPDRGSTFTVRLPLGGSDVDTPANDRAPEHRPPELRVLLVDDMPDIRESLGLILELEGHAVTEVACGREALEALERDAFDVALVDLGLPDLDGCDVARHARARSLPVTLIALSGFGREEDRVRTTSAGFDRHLTKPVSVEQLTGILRRLGEGEGARSEGASAKVTVDPG